jgi:hypothetical protein
MRSRLILYTCIAALGLTVAPEAPARASADELVDALTAIPGLTIVTERPAPPGYRFFLLTYEQPANHFLPGRGTFAQRISLLHRGTKAATVLYSSGYYGSTRPFTSAVTRIVDGNQVTIENRFFEPSRPDPANWGDLDIFQSAADFHRVISALKKVYAAPWLSTGASKGGMSVVYHRRFFPHDVNGTIADVAPNDVIDRADRYIDFIDHVGNDPVCRQRLEDVQRAALERRDVLVPMLIERFGAESYHHWGSADKAFEIMVVETPFTFWQFGAQSDCELVPDVDASDDELLAFFDIVQGLATWTDALIDVFHPYFVQAATQLGYPTVKQSHLADLLRFPGADVARTFVPADIPVGHFQQIAMIDVDVWVQLFASQMIFTYGELDPWGAERFRLGWGTRDSFVYEVAGGNHSANILQLPPAQQVEAVNAIHRWVGLPPVDAAAVSVLGLRSATGLPDQPETPLIRPRL